MEKSTKKWKSFGWEGSLALVGALAVGAFGLVGSCESDKTGQHPGGITGVTGAGGSYGFVRRRRRADRRDGAVAGERA